MIKHIRFNEQSDVCPFCHSTESQNEETLYDEGEVSVKIRCEDCDNFWWDVYTFAFTEYEEE